MTGQLTAAAFDQHPLPRELWPVQRYRRTDTELASSHGLRPAEQARLASHERAEIRFALAGNPSIAPDVQLRLAKDRVAALALAGNPSVCGAAQDELLMLRSQSITSALVAQAPLSPALLRTLLAGPTYRQALARNRQLPDGAYQHLLRHQDLAVRTALGGNPAVGDDVLHALARDPREPVRSAVAGNAALPQDLQRALAMDRATAVRRALAGNGALRPEVQLVLAGDAGARVDLACNRTIGAAVVDRLLASAADVGFGLAGHPALDLRQQQELVRLGGSAARARLAANPCLHPVPQLDLCNDLDDDIARQLARNPALVPQAQAQLADRLDPRIRAGLFGNPNLDRPALRILLDALLTDQRRWLDIAVQEGMPLGEGSRWARSHLDHPVRGPMIALLSGRSTLLDAAARHDDPLVRWGLLCNDRVGASRLGLLLNDSEEVIRQAAQTQIIAALAA